VLYFLSSARRNVVAGILLLWSMRTASASFLVTEHSIHDPRSGMTRQPCSGRSPSWHLDEEVDARASGGAG
jgi:hypothetical protein